MLLELPGQVLVAPAALARGWGSVKAKGDGWVSGSVLSAPE